MSLFEDASLVVTPNGRKASKIYSIKPTDGSGDLTVVRATTKTELNSSGVIVDVPINVPSFDYTNGSCPSILVEPQRTNLALRSQEFSNSIWTTNGNQITISENSTISPDGTNSADAILTTTENSNHYIQQRTGTATAGVTYTMSIYVKYLGYDYCRIQSSNTATAYATFRFSTKELILGGANVVANSGKVTEMKDGWFRIEMSILPPFAVTWRWWVIVLDNSMNETFIGDVSKGLYVYGFQLEVGSNATSYIPTVASAVTRNADVISKTGISDLIGQTEGTIFIDLDWSGNLTLPSRIFQINNGTTSSDIFFNINATTGNVQLFVNNVAKPLGTILSINTIKKLAFVYTTTSLKVFINGTLDINISESVTFALLDRLNIGSSNITSDRVANMRVNNFMIFKTALTNEQCINLTSI